ncbi:MAG TPA: DUF4032 domain-containing protein [Candidatus Dormibacteraeota bacterium]|nr:DUF4032 domain-containing protein [Candidatus Dormibacteraeota bacterium]
MLRPGHPELLELDWETSIVNWAPDRLIDLPRGISRHEVRFVSFGAGTYAIKELPLRPARRDYDALRRLEELEGPSVRPVGLVIRRREDPESERGAALITAYADYSFSYRELLSGESFGSRRAQLLDAFAMLLVQLHLLGAYWGDCSLSNVLYRYDAGALETIMVDAETASLYPSLSPGQREQDLQIMIENVGGEMFDIAASQGLPSDGADVGMGEEIATRYRSLWAEVQAEIDVPSDSQYLIQDRIKRLNDLGFEVKEMVVRPQAGTDHVSLKVQVADRNFHAHRLKALSGVEAGEQQARQILADVRYHQAKNGAGPSPAAKALAAMRWRVEVFEPILRRLSKHLGPGEDPVQRYTDLLHHRYMLSVGAGRDVGNDAALQNWLDSGMPGYPLPDSTVGL